MVLCENYRDQYQIGIWDFREDVLNLQVTSNDENQGGCLKVEVFEGQSHFQFASIEKKCVKFWKYGRKNLELLTRIHIKDEIVDS